MRAKVGEFYRHKWNKYVSKVTTVKRGQVELTTVNSGVAEFISTDNFDMNYEPCTTIYQWRKTIESIFSFGTIKLMGDCVRIMVDDTVLDFCIEDNCRLRVTFTDDIKEAVDGETNVLRFLIGDVDEVLQMFADLFE